jgi:hypothetical protein
MSVTPLKFEELEDIGDLMTVKEWLDSVACHAFIDYDGHGYWATATKQSNASVCPSDITDKKLVPPEWATHIVWYNR